MVGNSGDAGANLGGFGGSLSTDADAGVAPVLEDVSDAELDALVGKLRTDKNRIAPAVAEPRSREDMHAERLHRSRPLVSSVPETEGVCQAWYVGLDDQASGPHDVEALKGYWERGELGAESLCWREGFSAWMPLCQVPELARVLAPLPQARLPAPQAVPAGGDRVGDFEPKGAEALRSLVVDEDDPFPELDLEAARVDLSAPISTKEPVRGFTTEEVLGIPAGFVVASPGVPEARDTVAAASSGAIEGRAPVETADPVGTHAVLAPQEGRGAARWRSALWLALLGGVSGGVTVALVLALLGRLDGHELLTHLVSRETAGSSTAVNAGATPANTGATPSTVGGVPAGSVNAAPGATSTGPVGTAGAAAPGASAAPGAVGATAAGATGAGATPGAVGATAAGATGVGAAPGAVGATAAGATAPGAGAPLVGSMGLDKGGAVPVLNAAPRAATSSTGVASAPKTELSTVSPPSRAPAARPAVSAGAPVQEKRPAAPPPVTEASFASDDDDLGLDDIPAAEEKPAAALGPDPAYDRELSNPPKGATKKERTVYVPSDPATPPAELPQSAIFEVVLANKGDVTACAREQQAAPKEGGRVVVRWTILPTGKVSEVVTETASIKGTPLARCIEAKVSAWTFPKHQEQGAPVRFPFVF
ncbi:AgmX/PglI C-terminal domain-containing protein [Pyxidicoccus fallax]|uniref:AgmX/PglI C-terminal domain-containing protein n=1 Tax=Pyxidicoccus fallax TaxID=394095 RepID=A0A848LCX1_9BACT|nr:AgmX/PglI C-terminal domain-containing protein [Pyxidicoccus fallax]NMO16284.1 AgmX/PglI C-terminal domain-containing protein [Pyxidicoccus fallax]NPC81871.1 AgmX/PglI C-terminal domain-containing protein [Pyxidicoccus fallax]